MIFYSYADDIIPNYAATKIPAIAWKVADLPEPPRETLGDCTPEELRALAATDPQTDVGVALVSRAGELASYLERLATPA